MLSAILISCGDDPAAPADAGVADNNAGVSGGAQETGGDGDADAVPEKLLPDLPERNFEGYTFTFLAHQIGYDGDWTYPDPIELVSETESGEPIQDAVYRRNLQIMERYNIEIEMIASNNEVSLIRRSVGAGDDTYDAAVMFNNHVPGIVTGNLLVNIADLPFVDLDRPWWDPAVNALSIDNKNYLLGGDLLILDNAATNGLLFNKELMQDLGIELPYNRVKNGSWTMDYMHSIVRDAARDLDGDGAMGENDQWGFGTFNDTLHALFVAGGGALAVKDENDIPFMDFVSHRNLAMLDKVMDLMYNPEYVNNQQGIGGIDTRAAFSQGRILFLWGRMHLLEYYRDMEANFGVVPLPKYDENQAAYHSVVNPFTGVLLGIPKSAGDLERTSIILEALAAESRYTLQPAYYDIALQRKYVRDEESSEMLDIIFNSRVYDIGSVYAFGNVFLNFINLAARNDRNVMSFYERTIGNMETAIERIVNIFQDMD
jgi:ABC-type glycerol-3-phosphate transport system substrate-binding protein